MSLPSPLFIWLLIYFIHSSLLRKPHQPLVAGVPRIYSTFSLLSDEKPEKEPKLTFRKRIPHEIPRSFLFLASVGNSDTLWFVKLTNSEYGITVHQTLAANGLAPQLYGFKHLKGAPAAYVMEYLTITSNRWLGDLVQFCLQFARTTGTKGQGRHLACA